MSKGALKCDVWFLLNDFLHVTGRWQILRTRLNKQWEQQVPIQQKKNIYLGLLSIYYGKNGGLFSRSGVNIGINLCPCSLAPRGFKHNLVFHNRCQHFLLLNYKVAVGNTRTNVVVEFVWPVICRHYKSVPKMLNGPGNARWMSKGCLESVQVFCGSFPSHLQIWEVDKVMSQ